VRKATGSDCVLASLRFFIPLAGIASASLIPSNALAGGGGPSLTTTGEQVYVDDYTTTGTLSTSYSVDGTSSNALTQSSLLATASSSQIKLSADGSALVFGGYNAVVGTASEYSTPYLNRSIGIVSGTGSIDTTTQFLGTSGTPVPNALWLGGSNPILAAAGKYSVTKDTQSLSSVPASNFTTVTPTNANYFGGNLYVTATANNYFELNEVNGTTVTHLPGFPTAFVTGATSASDFVMTDADATNPYGFDRIYVANTSLGLQKWTYNGSAYVNVWSLASNATTTGFAPDPSSTFLKSLVLTTDGAGNNILYGIAVDSVVKSYGSTAYDDTYLVSLTDPDNSTSVGTDSYTVLASGTYGDELAGVAFAPSGSGFGSGDLAVLQVGSAVPEPASLGILGLGAVGLLIRRRRVQA
jgi:hypothetical protein